MAHLPRIGLYQLIAQRQRVLRGRDLTRWERFKDWYPYVDFWDVVFGIMFAAAIADLILLGIILGALVVADR